MIDFGLFPKVDVNTIKLVAKVGAGRGRGSALIEQP